jgi:glycosyltransferase involved in cell wall biosynthesis
MVRRGLPVRRQRFGQLDPSYRVLDRAGGLAVGDPRGCRAGSAPRRAPPVIEVSVVIPAFRAAATLERACRSVAREGGSATECVIVLDGRDEATAAVALGCADPLVVQTTRNLGPGGARNVGLAASSGEYVLFLDADDYVEGGLIGGLLRAMIVSGADLGLGECVHEAPEGSRGPHAGPRAEDGRGLVAEWLGGRFVPPCCVMWRTAFLRSIGGWNESLRRNEDGELVLRAALRGARIAASRVGTGVYVQHPSPDRVSQRLDEAALADELGLMAWLRAELEQRGWLDERMRAALIGYVYNWRRTAFRHDRKRAAAEFTAVWRQLGGRRDEGTIAHRLVSQVLGLSRKERLASWLRT